MQHRKTLLAALGAFALVLAASAAQAETGTVVSVDDTANTLTIRTDAGTQMTFQVDEQTMFRSGDRTITLGELQNGMRVDVSAEDATAAGERVARTITVEDDTAAGAPAATATGDQATEPGATAGARAESRGMADDPGDPNRARTPDDDDTTTGMRDTTAGDPDTTMDDTRMRDERTDVAGARLPDTASPLPLIGLLGIASLGLGLALRRLR